MTAGSVHPLTQKVQPTILVLLENIGHVLSNLHLKSKMEVLRENTSFSHRNGNISSTGGTLKALLRSNLLHFLVKALTAEGVQTWQYSWVSEGIRAHQAGHLMWKGSLCTHSTDNWDETVIAQSWD